jgi:hypothetical protein
MSLENLPPRIEEQLQDIWHFDYAVATEEYSDTGRPGFFLAESFEAAVSAKVAAGRGVVYRIRWNPNWDRISWQKVPDRQYARLEEQIRTKVESAVS